MPSDRNGIPGHEKSPVERMAVHLCPECLGSFGIPLSGWSSRSKSATRSDGAVTPVNRRPFPDWVECPGCGAPVRIFNPEEPFKLVQDDTGADRDIQVVSPGQGIEAYKQLQPETCLNFAVSDKLTNEEKESLLEHAWHALNDRREASGQWELSDTDTDILEALLLRSDGPAHKEVLRRAELLRELGRFDEAAEALDCDFHSDGLAAHAEQVMRAVEKQDPRPFVFVTDDWGDDSEYAFAWQGRRYRPAIPEAPQGPLKPPLLQISNRDWWVKVLGMMSHNWALLEAQAGGKVIVYFFHDEGGTLGPPSDGDWQLKGRSAVVDSLEFESMDEATAALSYNDFSPLKKNPGPWIGYEPEGHFYDARATEEGIYSRKGYWQSIDRN